MAASETLEDQLAARTERFAGSGIPLSAAFRLVLLRLMKGPASVHEAAEEIRADRGLTLNRARIITTWGLPVEKAKTGSRGVPEWDKWSARNLAQDILDQLEYLKLVFSPDGGRWELSGNFDPSERYVVLMKDGKQLTHVRVNERETRLNRSKLSEAQFAVLAAQRLVSEAGAATRETGAFFDGLLRLLQPENAGKAAREERPRRVGNPPRVVTPDQPPDAMPASEGVLAFGRHWRPEDITACTRCGTPKPVAREFYEVYLSKGIWRFRADCKTCHRSKRKYEYASQEVRKLIEAGQAQGGVPAISEISRQTGLHHLTVRAAWSQLCREDKNFPEVPGPMSSTERDRWRTKKS